MCDGYHADGDPGLFHHVKYQQLPDTCGIFDIRDAVLLSLLYDTGARVQELVDLKVCDIALNDTVTIILTGKGGKSRIVPVMKPTGELLKQYMEGAGLSSPAYSRTPLFTNVWTPFNFA